MLSVAGGVGRLFSIFQSGWKAEECEGHIRAEILHHPLGEAFQLGFGVVFPRDQQGGDLQPDTGLMLEVLQGLQHRLQMPATDSMVKILGESL